MKPTSTPPTARRPARRLWLWGLLATPLLLLLLLGAGVASFFHLSPDVRALRNGLLKSGGVELRQRVALNAGRLMVYAVRAGLTGVQLDPGARAALQSVQAAGVGVYQLTSATQPPDRATMLAAADLAMTVRGWDQVVGALDGHDLVAVYMPERNASVRRLKCCLLVFDGKQMVLVSVQGNPQPLLKYALNQTDMRQTEFKQPLGLIANYSCHAAAPAFNATPVGKSAVPARSRMARPAIGRWWSGPAD